MKRLKNGALRAVFKISCIWKSVCVEVRPEVCRQILPICKEPSFHDLHHKVQLVIAGILRAFPIVSVARENVLPRLRGNWTLAINQEDWELILLSVSQGDAKVVICMLPASAGMDGGLSPS